MVERFLPEEMLGQWLDDLSKEGSLYVPVREGQAVIFRPYVTGTEVILDQQPTMPAKEVLFPKSEPLFAYSYLQTIDEQGGGGKVKRTVELTVSQVDEQLIIFGERVCGARGFLIFDPVFAAGMRADPLYSARREKCLIITLACLDRENTCFCHWVGSSPVDKSGSDILLTKVESGFFVQCVSKRGEEVVNGSTLMLAAPAELKTKVESMHKKAVEDLPPAPDLSGVIQALEARFSDLGFWQAVSAKCLSCGACTYLCPTCYCFNITDEAQGNRGVRLKSWDNCLSYQYTLEASGHNPRPTKVQRLRNRVNHKFCYYPKDHGQFACCGCGRCIKFCPVAVDIREIVLKAKEGMDDEN